MLHIRTVRTKGNSRSVQVYCYRKGKRVIVKHIGSGTTDAEIVVLNEMARLFIDDRTKQTYLFEDSRPNENKILVSQCDYIGFLLYLSVRCASGGTVQARLYHRSGYAFE